MCVSREIANSIVDSLPSDRSFKIDPMLALSIASIVINGVRLILTCHKTPQDGLKRVQNLSWWDRIRLRSHVKSELKQNYPQYDRKEIRAGVQEAMLKLSKSATIEQMTAMYKEAAR